MRRFNGAEIALIVVLLLVIGGTVMAGTSLSKFDKILLGPTVSQSGRINIAPGTTTASGIYFGETALYRSAASQLKLAGSAYVQDDTILGHAADHTTTIAGNTTVGGTLGVTGAQTNTGNLSVQGNTTLGNAATDTITCTGRLILRTLGSDPLDATPANRPAGSVGEIGIYSAVIYMCTDATEDAEVWVRVTDTPAG